MDKTQTKLSTPQVRYKGKTLHQKLTIQDKLISEKNFERKALGVVSRFLPEKSFNT